jgi:hypothetical protein
VGGNVCIQRLKVLHVKQYYIYNLPPFCVPHMNDFNSWSGLALSCIWVLLHLQVPLVQMYFKRKHRYEIENDAELGDDDDVKELEPSSI